MFADVRVRAMFEAIVQAECRVQGWKVVAFETMPDHVHLLLLFLEGQPPHSWRGSLKGSRRGS